MEKRARFGLLTAIVALAASLHGSHQAFGQVAPPLGSAGSYTVLGTNDIPTSGTVTCTTSTIDGDVGSTFGSITDTGCTITGVVDAPVASSVEADFDAAYASLDTMNPTCDGVIPTVSSVLPPGVYCSDAGTTLTSVTFTLDGTASDVWVFKVGTGGTGALTGTSFLMETTGGAQACNVYWWTADAASMTDSDFLGTVLSGDAVTLTRGSWIGRAQATTDVTVTSSTIAGCAGGTVAPTEIPTLGFGALAALGLLLAGGALLVLRRH